jgi:hypothetical protein
MQTREQHMSIRQGACLSLLLLLFFSAAIASEISDEELERWFHSNSLEPPRYHEVNEGQLTFLAVAPKQNLHHNANALTIKPQSLRDGWILVEQCHTNLDQVPASEVLFNKNNIRNIKILDHENIEKTWIEGSSVQMQNVHANAKLCLQVESRALHHNGDGSFILRNGPFMRRFLDGYYPLSLSMDLDYSTTGLTLVAVSPPAQTGFSIKRSAGRVHIEALFEGKLRTEFQFMSKNL